MQIALVSVRSARVGVHAELCFITIQESNGAASRRRTASASRNLTCTCAISLHLYYLIYVIKAVQKLKISVFHEVPRVDRFFVTFLRFF